MLLVFCFCSFTQTLVLSALEPGTGPFGNSPFPIYLPPTLTPTGVDSCMGTAPGKVMRGDLCEGGGEGDGV